ncbi:hypothetical protein ACFFNY_03390 [Paenibacillus hodogayensis]|uniref:Uncharacterized protein n=1 Tax=Paenibacillus hodogayensis TaxID=279208 RepID=A0ABV5VRD8_9BACL
MVLVLGKYAVKRGNGKMNVQVKRKSISEKEQKVIQFVKQNYKGLYAMSEWLESRKRGLAAQPESAAAGR